MQNKTTKNNHDNIPTTNASAAFPLFDAHILDDVKQQKTTKRGVLKLLLSIKFILCYLIHQYLDLGSKRGSCII